MPEGSAHPVLRYLREVGWSQAELARRANLNRTVISRAVRGEQPMGRFAATQIARVTAEAFAAGVTKILPLQASELCPKLSRTREAA